MTIILNKIGLYVERLVLMQETCFFGFCDVTNSFGPVITRPVVNEKTDIFETLHQSFLSFSTLMKLIGSSFEVISKS